MIIWILLPSFNEFPNIRNLVNDLNKSTFLSSYRVRIVIVDDGSTDEIEKEHKKFFLKKNYKIYYLKHRTNQGLSAALNTGFKFILKNSINQKDIMITMDADCTHRIRYLLPMINKIISGSDIVIASRFLKNSKVIGLSFFREILSLFASCLYRFFFKIGIREFTCNFRAYKVLLLKKYFRKNINFISEKGFVCIPDILLKIHKYNKKILISEIPFTLRYDLKKGFSKMSIFYTVLKTFNLIIKRKFFI